MESVRLRDIPLPLAVFPALDALPEGRMLWLSPFPTISYPRVEVWIVACLFGWVEKIVSTAWNAAEMGTPMKNTLKKFFGIAFTGLILSGFSAMLMLGKAEYTKKEGKLCMTCHVKNGSKELNDVGKCYAKDHSLKDCQVSEEKK